MSHAMNWDVRPSGVTLKLSADGADRSLLPLGNFSGSALKSALFLIGGNNMKTKKSNLEKFIEKSIDFDKVKPSNEVKHTPTPWQIQTDGDYCGIYDADGEKVAGFNFPSIREDEMWRKIVKAVNSHDKLTRDNEALLGALELARATIERLKPPTPFDSTQGTRDVIDQVIKQSEVK